MDASPTDPRPWWHTALAGEVERRDRDLAERIDALEELQPGVVADRLRRVEEQQQSDALFLRRFVTAALVAIPALTALAERLIPGG